MIAVGSRWRWLDMAFIAWRNLRLIKPRLQRCTALSSGITAVCDCFAWCCLSIAFAGASELVREVGVDWMSQDLANARHGARRAGHWRRPADRPASRDQGDGAVPPAAVDRR
ncbi:hypothetical protein LN650_18735 [Klebsiella pneumoniae subsp. pneumoniae]|nr:hypothetical protein [Klebsiella pneumoniae subsp. pneumoniae]